MNYQFHYNCYCSKCQSNVESVLLKHRKDIIARRCSACDELTIDYFTCGNCDRHYHRSGWCHVPRLNYKVHLDQCSICRVTNFTAKERFAAQKYNQQSRKRELLLQLFFDMYRINPNLTDAVKAAGLPGLGQSTRRLMQQLLIQYGEAKVPFQEVTKKILELVGEENVRPYMESQLLLAGMLIENMFRYHKEEDAVWSLADPRSMARFFSRRGRLNSVVWGMQYGNEPGRRILEMMIQIVKEYVSDRRVSEPEFDGATFVENLAKLFVEHGKLGANRARWMSSDARKELEVMAPPARKRAKILEEMVDYAKRTIDLVERLKRV
jgi:hypothetical protein